MLLYKFTFNSNHSRSRALEMERQRFRETDDKEVIEIFDNNFEQWHEVPIAFLFIDEAQDKGFGIFKFNTFQDDQALACAFFRAKMKIFFEDQIRQLENKITDITESQFT